jgi:prevent-host-death family protein
MTNIVSALTARTQLGQILRRASKNNERFVVDRRGQPTVVIMSIKDYVNAIAPPPQWLKAIQTASKHRGTHKLSMRQINAEIAAARHQEQEKQKGKQPLR